MREGKTGRRVSDRFVRSPLRSFVQLTAQKGRLLSDPDSGKNMKNKRSDGRVKFSCNADVYDQMRL